MQNRHKEIFNSIIIILYFLNAIALNEIICASYAKWYFKYFTIAFAVFGAFFILFIISKSEYHSIEISKSDSYNYMSNIEYIRNQTGLLEEDVILKAINQYSKELELKENTDKSFPDFETLYNQFQTLEVKDKRFLLLQLPTEYHTKLLKELIKDK